MILTKVRTSERGSCSFCTDSVTNMYVYEFTRDMNGGLSVRICLDCLTELNKKVNDMQEARKKK